MSALERRERMAIGTPVNVAARLQQHAEPGEIIVGPACHAATESVGTFEALPPLTLKGLGETEAWRFIDFATVVEGVSPDIPFVGRRDELAALVNAAGAALDGRVANLAVLVGEPGLGKSRLAHEAIAVATASRDARVVELRCRPAGEAGSNSPLRQLFDAIDP